MADRPKPVSRETPEEKLTLHKATPAPVAVVEDEEDIASLVAMHLERAGFAPAVFHAGGEFLSWFRVNTPSLVILDVMLPDIQGTDICKMIRSSRERPSTPVIMLTALGHETDRVLGLELGADDYVVKPFSPRELVARVRAVLRRTAGAETPPENLSWGPISLHPGSFRAAVNGAPVDLTPTEFRILEALVEGAGRVLTRASLLDLLWEGEKFVFERTIDVHVAHIREKLGDAGRLLGSVRGIGYRMVN